MTTPDELLSAIVSQPDDDGPRRVWADLVAGERGELVQLQCELATLGGTLEQRVQLQRREHQLLLDHGVALSGLEGLADGLLFRRGFVEWASVDARVFLARGEELFEKAPLLNSLRISGMTAERDPLKRAAAVIAHPLLEHVQHFGLGPVALQTDGRGDDWYDFQYFPEETIALLARSGLRLRSLQTYKMNEKGLRKLLDAGTLTELESLDGVPLKLATEGLFPKLARLVATESAHHNREAIRALPATLRELHLSNISDESLEDLASSPAARGLRRMQLHHGTLRSDASAFSAFTSLRSLDLGDTPLGQPGYAQSKADVLATLTRVELPSLRELRLPTGLPLELLRSVSIAFGRHLEFLDLQGQSVFKEEERKELAALVAGEVRFGDWEMPKYPLQRAAADGESWLGRTILPAGGLENWAPYE